MAVIDFEDTSPDGARKLIRSAYDEAKEKQFERNEQYRRNNDLYHGISPLKGYDPARANIFWPKIFNIVNTILPRHIRASHSSRPYLPFTARRDEFQQIVDNQSEILDFQLHKAQFIDKRVQQNIIAITHGTSFMASRPYHKMITETYVLKGPDGQPMVDPNSGMPVVQERTVPRVRLDLKVYAPWDVYMDPIWTGLEAENQCRYAIMLEVTSFSQMKREQEQGLLPKSLDIQAAMDHRGETELTENFGFELMSGMGLSVPDHDSDIGVLLRMETPTRRIFAWDGERILLDQDNPHKHGLINLSRGTYGQIPHTLNSAWGLGAVKPNELLQLALNDTQNMTFDNAMMATQAMVAHRVDAIDSDQIVMTPGNRLPIKSSFIGSIDDAIKIMATPGLPKEHFVLADEIERFMDLVSKVYDAQRGEGQEVQGTASEFAMRQQAGDIGLELEVKVDERFLSDFGFKTISNLNQVMTLDDKAEILGAEKAIATYTLSPDGLPGGANWEFKGADRVVNLGIRQQQFDALYPQLAESPAVKRVELDKYRLELGEVEPAVIDRLIKTEEEMQQEQEQAMQSQIQAEQQAGQQQAQMDQQAAQVQAQTDVQIKQMEGQLEAQKLQLEGIQDAQLVQVKGQVDSQLQAQEDQADTEQQILKAQTDAIALGQKHENDLELEAERAKNKPEKQGVTSN